MLGFVYSRTVTDNQAPHNCRNTLLCCHLSRLFVHREYNGKVPLIDTKILDPLLCCQFVGWPLLASAGSARPTFQSAKDTYSIRITGESHHEEEQTGIGRRF